MGIVRKALAILLAVAASLPLKAQQQTEQSDSLVRLLKSQYVQMVDVEGGRYRKVVGPARFLHNDTYLLCDTAYWNVETNIIDAWGNVSILQEETVLTSDKLIYLVDDDLAQFRGSVVELTDKDHNTLRTRHLDYNTKDSVAVFMFGGSMRDKDGQIIESRNGTYDSKISTFTFDIDVNMFTDSIFVNTRNLVYESDLDLATFGHQTNAWKDDNMLSAESGWYDRGKELFLFKDNVHVMTVDQEGWCDSLYFDRMSTGVEMLGNAQITDNTRNVYALAGRIDYVDSISKVTLTRKPAVITQTDTEDGGVDTVYLGADRLVYYTMKMCDIDQSVVKDAEKRLEALNTDPVGTFRKKAAEEAAKSAEEAAKRDPNYRPQAMPRASAAPISGPGLDSLRTAVADSLAKRKAAADTTKSTRPMSGRGQGTSLLDSLINARKSQMDTARTESTPVMADSAATPVSPMMPMMPMMPNGIASQDSLMNADTSAVADSSALVPPDTTKIGFLEAIGSVKVFRKDMQIVCDSLTYTDLDSLARLFKEPIVYQEIVRQYRADSISIVVNEGTLEKASLMSNAFITIQEDTSHYNQIKGAEMMAYFDEKGGLKRFDVLGGASALFFLEENGALATVNKTDSKMMSATFKDGEIQRIYYFEEAKNDGYPVVQLGSDEHQLKGYTWNPDRRPADRYAVTPLTLRPSQRESYSARPRAKFVQTDIYFPGYIDDIYRQMEVRDSLRVVRDRERALAEQRAKTQARLDSLALADSLANADAMAKLDSLAAVENPQLSGSRTDSTSVSNILDHADSITVAEPLTPDQIRAAEKAAAKEAKARKKAEVKAAKEAKKKAKQEALEAKWAEADKRDAEKAAAKAAKKLKKERDKKRKALADEQRQKDKDAALVEKYRAKFEKKKAREDAKAAAKEAARKAAEDAETAEKIEALMNSGMSSSEIGTAINELINVEDGKRLELDDSKIQVL